MAFEEEKQYYCDKCHRTMSSDNFYKSNNLEKYGDNDGYLHVCKKCLTMHVDNWNPDSFKPILMDIDVPWIPDEWNLLLQKYGKNRSNVTGTTILGRYLSKMKLKQYKDFRWKDTDFIQEISDTKMRESLKRQGFDAAEIEEAIRQNRIPVPAEPVLDGDGEDMGSNGATGMFRPMREEVDLGLTDEDKAYLRLKWGSTYTQEEWVKLETQYNEMMNSYDIQTAGHKDTLKMICKTYLKANQLIDIGDIEGYQKAMKVYNDLMHAGNFTAVQNKTDNGEYIDSISELVAICEKDGFIPRYYVEEPKDRIDRVLQDLQGYTRSLIMEETNLGNMIEGALKQIEVDNEKAARINTDDGEDDDEAQRLLEESLFAEPEEIELDDEDFEDFKSWENSQDEEE